MIMNRKPFLLSALVAGSVMTASAVLMLPEPKLTGEHVSDGKVRITWEFSSEDAPDPYFQVVVYKRQPPRRTSCSPIRISAT